MWLLAGWVMVSPALAWNAAGHRIIASIAFRQLSEEEQGQIVALLKKHPRFAADFAEEMPEEVRSGDEKAQNEWLFQQAAVWPDMVRGGPPEKRAFNRSEWHYINLPLFLNEAAKAELEGKLTVNVATDVPGDATTDTARMNVVQAIRFARRECADPAASPQSRAVLLAWAFHTVGDIHQPLHGSAMFSPRLFPEGDRGGNSVRVQQAGNLHSLWDQFPGADDSFRATRNRAIGYLNDPAFADLGKLAADDLDEPSWAVDSQGLAKQAVYDAEIMAALARMESVGRIESIDLSEAYLKAGGRIAERRLVEAGYRLGAVLKEVVKQ
jgi:hypothetical protein